MKKIGKAVVCLLLTLAMLVTCVVTGFAASKKKNDLLVGVGRGDITGPITSISTGYNSFPDLMQNAKVLISNYDSLLAVYLVVAVIYILINYLLNRASDLAAKRMHQTKGVTAI